MGAKPFVIFFLLLSVGGPRSALGLPPEAEFGLGGLGALGLDDVPPPAPSTPTASPPGNVPGLPQPPGAVPTASGTPTPISPPGEETGGNAVAPPSEQSFAIPSPAPGEAPRPSSAPVDASFVGQWGEDKKFLEALEKQGEEQATKAPVGRPEEEPRQHLPRNTEPPAEMMGNTETFSTSARIETVRAMPAPDIDLREPAPAIRAMAPDRIEATGGGMSSVSVSTSPVELSRPVSTRASVLSPDIGISTAAEAIGVATALPEVAATGGSTPVDVETAPPVREEERAESLADVLSLPPEISMGRRPAKGLEKSWLYRGLEAMKKMKGFLLGRRPARKGRTLAEEYRFPTSLAGTFPMGGVSEETEISLAELVLFRSVLRWLAAVLGLSVMLLFFFFWKRRRRGESE